MTSSSTSTPRQNPKQTYSLPPGISQGCPCSTPNVVTLVTVFARVDQLPILGINSGPYDGYINPYYKIDGRPYHRKATGV